MIPPPDIRTNPPNVTLFKTVLPTTEISDRLLKEVKGNIHNWQDNNNGSMSVCFTKLNHIVHTSATKNLRASVRLLFETSDHCRLKKGRVRGVILSIKHLFNLQ
jgi:hypothetical protein